MGNHKRPSDWLTRADKRHWLDDDRNDISLLEACVIAAVAGGFAMLILRALGA